MLYCALEVMGLTIGEKIKEVRTARGMTQQEVADAIGIAYQNISQYERGVRTPKMDTLRKIAAVLSVDAWELAGWNPIETNPSVLAADLEDRIEKLGYSIGYEDDNTALWINYPDGSALGVTEEDLQTIIDNADKYLCFLLEDLRKRLPKYLTPPSPAKPEGDE